MRWFLWLLLQIAVVCFAIWLVDDPEKTGGAVVFGLIASLIVTGLLSRLLDVLAGLRARVAKRKDAKRQSLGVPRAGRKTGDGPQLSDRRRIRQDIR